MRRWTHGTLYGYQQGCRCEACRATWSAANLRGRAARAARLAADPGLAVHGSDSTYSNWGCRCAQCTAAHSVATHRYYYNQGRHR